VSTLLKNPDCGNFVRATLDKVAELYPNNPVISDNVLDLYDAVKSQGGFRFEQAIVRGKPAGGTVEGSYT
jgi:hypothetical protein